MFLSVGELCLGRNTGRDQEAASEGKKRENIVEERGFHNNILGQGATLEEELSSLALIMKKPRDRKIIISYLGWDGKGKKRLQAVADKFGITRERVRQIANRFEERFKKKGEKKITDMPLLQRALSLVESNIPALASELESKLEEARIAKSAFRVEGIRTAAQIMEREVTFRVEKLRKITMQRIVISSGDVSHVRPTMRMARKDIKFRGAASVSDIARRFYGESFASKARNFIAVVLRSLEYFQWLDRKGEWFWFSDARKNHLIKKIKKILAVVDSITIADMHDGIKRSSRVRGVAPPADVLLELCRQNEWCSVEDDMIIADPRENFERYLSGGERELQEVFEEHGPMIAMSDIKRICSDRGKGFLSTEQYLLDSPIFKSYEHDVFGLIGADKLGRKG